MWNLPSCVCIDFACVVLINNITAFWSAMFVKQTFNQCVPLWCTIALWLWFSFCMCVFLCNDRQVVLNIYRCKSLNYTSLYQQGPFSKTMTMMRSCPSTCGAECLSVVHHVVWLKYVHILLIHIYILNNRFFYMFCQSHNLTSYLM